MMSTRQISAYPVGARALPRALRTAVVERRLSTGCGVLIGAVTSAILWTTIVAAVWRLFT